MITTQYSICLNRYCPKAYTMLCSACRPDHRDHTTKIMSIEDLCFLLDRLLKKPVHQVGRYMSDSISIMKKLQIMGEFKKKISALEAEIRKETFDLL